MHNSKIKILIRAVAFCLLAAALLGVCNFLLYDDNTYTRLMLHEMYESEEPIDLVFISGSVTYKSFDPVIWDEELGIHSFNLGSSSQTPDGSYYLMKEVFRHHKPKYCLFATTYVSFMDGYDNPQRNYILYDHMRPSLNKLNYWANVFNEDTALTAALPFMRNKTLSFSRITEALDNLKMKTSEAYRSYSYDIYDNSIETYQGRGFVYRNEAKEPGGVGRLEPVWFSRERIDPNSVAYLGKLADLCRDNGCELILIPTPAPYGAMAMQEDYQQIADFYQELARDNGLKIFDFSLSRPELFDAKDEYFYDYVHLNGPGSTAFSRAAASVVKDYLEGREIQEDTLFYGSFQELMESSPYIFNTWLEFDGEGYLAQSTCGAGVEPEYRYLARFGEEWLCIQDYGISSGLSVQNIPESAEEIRMEARPQGSSQDFQQYDSMKR